MESKICPICGNDISVGTPRCRYCNSPLKGETRPAVKSNRIYTVNLEAGLPTVEEGLARLENELLQAGHSGVCLVRVIHGWGSSGVGGKLKGACRSFLRGKTVTGQIKGFLPGEDYSGSSLTGKNLIRRYPKLKGSLRTDRRNQGITFIEL